MRHNINQRIRAQEVRLVSEGENKICSLREALDEAKLQDLDLVEISPNAKPPVVKIIDYKKFLYEQKKKVKGPQKPKTKLKEIRYTPTTDEHDYNFKLNHAKNFLGSNNSLKASIFFKGRMIKYKDQGYVLLNRLIKDLEEHGSPDAMPKMEGKRMIIIFKPLKK